MPKIATIDTGEAAEETRKTAQASISAAREGLQLGQLFTQLFQEQIRHALQVATAFGRTANWGEAAEIQSEFIRATFRRMNEFNSHYLESVRAMMTMVTPRVEPKRAA